MKYIKACDECLIHRNTFNDHILTIHRDQCSVWSSLTLERPGSESTKYKKSRSFEELEATRRVNALFSTWNIYHRFVWVLHVWSVYIHSGSFYNGYIYHSLHRKFLKSHLFTVRSSSENLVWIPCKKCSRIGSLTESLLLCWSSPKSSLLL